MRLGFGWGDFEVGAEFLEFGGADAGDFEEVAELAEGAGGDDLVGGGFADAGDGHEFVAGCGVEVDLVGGVGFLLVFGDFDFCDFIAGFFAEGGEFIPVGVFPCAEAFTGGCEFEVFELFGPFVGAG